MRQRLARGWLPGPGCDFVPEKAVTAVTPFMRRGFVCVARRYRRRVFRVSAQRTPVGPPSLVQEGVWDVFDGLHLLCRHQRHA